MGIYSRVFNPIWYAFDRDYDIIKHYNCAAILQEEAEEELRYWIQQVGVNIKCTKVPLRIRSELRNAGL